MRIDLLNPSYDTAYDIDYNASILDEKGVEESFL